MPLTLEVLHHDQYFLQAASLLARFTDTGKWMSMQSAVQGAALFHCAGWQLLLLLS